MAIVELVKIKDVKTGAIMEVKKSLASDYIGTQRFTLCNEKSKDVKDSLNKENDKPFFKKNED